MGIKFRSLNVHGRYFIKYLSYLPNPGLLFLYPSIFCSLKIIYVGIVYFKSECCTCMYERYVHVGRARCRGCFKCRGQRRTSVVPTLFESGSLVVHPCILWAAFSASVYPPISASLVAVGVLGLQPRYICVLGTCILHTCIARVFLTEPSP